MTVVHFPRTLAPSRLTGGGAAYEPFGFFDSPPTWLLAIEKDGLRYVVSRRWLVAVARSPLAEETRAQALLAARYFSRAGSCAAFVGAADRDAFARDRLAALFGPLEPWFVPG